LGTAPGLLPLISNWNGPKKSIYYFSLR